VIKQISEDQILVSVADIEVVTQAECPHRKGRLRFGKVNPRRLTITCPLHHSTFDLRTGEQVSGPPCGSITVSVLE
jgi:nitrite reductase/ring-hydroxylating ferredoxin subunit